MANQSPLMRKYNALRAAKRMNCEGKKTQAQVKQAASAYVTAAVKKGQTKAEAMKKARNVLTAGCKMSSNIAGKDHTAVVAGVRKRKVTLADLSSPAPKRKTTARRRK